MPTRIISADEIQKMIDQDPDDDAVSIEVMQILLNMAKGKFTIFYNNDDEKFFAVEEGKPIPFHLHDMFLTAN